MTEVSCISRSRLLYFVTRSRSMSFSNAASSLYRHLGYTKAARWFEREVGETTPRSRRCVLLKKLSTIMSVYFRKLPVTLPFFFLYLTISSIFISKKCLAILRTFLVMTSERNLVLELSSLITLLTKIECRSCFSSFENPPFASSRQAFFQSDCRCFGLRGPVFMVICGCNLLLKRGAYFISLGSTDIPFSLGSPNFK